MELKHAKQIVRAAHKLGLDAELKTAYSGRGMHGKEAAAVEIDDLLDLASIAAQAALDSEDADDLIEGLAEIKSDSLGKNKVIY